MNPIEDWLTQPDGPVDRLRAMREQAGFSGKQLAEAVGWHPSKVSKIENGKQVPTAADLEAWSRATGATPVALQELLGLLDEVHAIHRDWKRRMRRGQEVVQASYNQLVSDSKVIRYFETVYVPGFLQTPEYARRVFTEMVELHGLEVDDVDAAVMVRMERQRFLYDPAKRFEFLLAEPVLRWWLCPPAVMAGQLDRLHSVIGQANIRFGILPMRRRLATTPQNSFQMYDDLVVVETFVGETSHRDDVAARYAKVMEMLWAEAATGEHARQLILSAAADVTREGQT